MPREGAPTSFAKTKRRQPLAQPKVQPPAITFARCNQIRLSVMIEEAVLNIFDSKLNAKLMYLLLLHRKTG